MPKVPKIEKHPQRDKILEALIAGESCEAVAAWTRPKIERTTIWRYWRNVVQPTLQRVATVATVADPPKSVSNLTHSVDPQTAAATKQAIIDSPIISIKEKRLAALQDRWNRLATIMEERAADMADAPGGKSGLLTRQFKQLGAQIVEEFKLDTGLLAEFREHEKQAAQELGQWVDSSSAQSPTISVNLLLGLPRGEPQTEKAAPIEAADVKFLA